VQPLQVDDLLFYCALGVIVGGRLGYALFYDAGAWLDDPLRLLRVWEGGMSFHGGFLGVLVALWLYGRRTGAGFWRLADFVAPLVPLGLFAGRIGNFINGELWGAPADVPWAMQVACASNPVLCLDKLGLAAGTLLTPPLHPSQLYQALLEGLVLFVVLWWFSRRPRPAMVVSGVFLLGYGLARFVVEFVRLPDAHIGYLAGGWLTMGQVLSAPMIVIGTLLVIHGYTRKA
jgi:phosphatidylglycerol:prolipoprotein diacylglycerol transferase